jgi:hypothetical protein
MIVDVLMERNARSLDCEFCSLCEQDSPLGMTEIGGDNE